MNSLPNEMAVDAGEEGDVLALAKSAWRWKGLLLFGLILGMIAGWLIYIQMPPEYTSRAMVQFIDPSQRGTPGTVLNLNDTASSQMRQDEIRIWRSEAVISLAIEAGKLTQHPRFATATVQEIAGFIVDEDHLSIEPGTKDANTSLVEIRFTCDDRELATEIVQALLDGYQKYLDEIQADEGGEIIDALARFSDEFDQRFQRARKEYITLRSGLDSVIIDGDHIRDTFADYVLETNRKIAEVNYEINAIDNVVQQVNRMVEEGQTPESILGLLALNRTISATVGTDLSVMEKITVESSMNADTGEVQRLREAILQAELELERNTNNYAQNHPAIKSLQNGLDRLRTQLKDAEANAEAAREALRNRLASDARESLSSQDRVQNALTAIANYRRNLDGQRERLVAEADEAESKSQQLQSTLANIEVQKQEMESFRDLSKDLMVAIQNMRIGVESIRKTMKIADPASAAYRSGPKLLYYLGGGGLLGLVLFGGLVYLLELADRSYRSPEDIIASLQMPVIGHIAAFESDLSAAADSKLDPSIITAHRPDSSAAECYRGIRTAIFFASRAADAKVIQITSPQPGDGKSTLACNTAVALARSGRRTLIVDGDLRRPRVAKIFGVTTQRGLSNSIVEGLDYRECVSDCEIENLDIFPAGPRVSNPAELLMKPQFQSLIGDLRADYDFIIIDSPPVLSVSDPASIAPLMDGVILTSRLRRNSRPMCEQSKNIIQSVGGTLIGIVVNGVGDKSTYGYGGYRYDNSGIAGYSYGGNGYGGYGYGRSNGYVDDRPVYDDRPTVSPGRQKV